MTAGLHDATATLATSTVAGARTTAAPFVSRTRLRGIAVGASIGASVALAACSADVVRDRGDGAGLAPYRIVGDGIPQPLVEGGGDAARGRALLVARVDANCVLCHALPEGIVRFSGSLGPSLAGVGARLTLPQLRLRIVDGTHLDPGTAMPAYYRVDGLDHVAGAYRGKPVLAAGQIEDVVAYLATLR